VFDGPADLDHEDDLILSVLPPGRPPPSSHSHGPETDDDELPRIVKVPTLYGVRACGGIQRDLGMLRRMAVSAMIIPARVLRRMGKIEKGSPRRDEKTNVLKRQKLERIDSQRRKCEYRARRRTEEGPKGNKLTQEYDQKKKYR